MDHPRELHGRLRRFVERVADESPRLADQATIRA
jgi:hypothetical protein